MKFFYGMSIFGFLLAINAFGQKNDWEKGGSVFGKKSS